MRSVILEDCEQDRVHFGRAKIRVVFLHCLVKRELVSQKEESSEKRKFNSRVFEAVAYNPQRLHPFSILHSFLLSVLGVQ